MKRQLLLLSFALLFSSSMVFGQSVLSGNLDRPISTLKAERAEGTGVVPDIPDEPEVPDIPAEPEEDPPTFMGEELKGSKIVLVLDFSDSMKYSLSVGYPVYNSSGSMVSNPSRLEVVKSEAAKAISGFDPDVEFDVVLFGRRVATCFGALTEATAANKMQAIAWMYPKGTTCGTATYDALCVGFNNYGNELDLLMLMTDGAPWGAPGAGIGFVKGAGAESGRVALELTQASIPQQVKPHFQMLLIQVGSMTNWTRDMSQVPKVNVSSK